MRQLINHLFARMTPFGAIIASVAAILIGPRLVTILVAQVPERYAPSAGLVIPLMIVMTIAAFVGVTQLFFGLHLLVGRLRQAWYGRLDISRAIVRVGDRDIDGWIDEGLAAYGSVNRVVAAGIIGGLLLPWLTVVLGGYLYNLATGWYADSFFKSLDGSFGSSFSLSSLWTNLFLGAYGGLFVLIKRWALRRRLANPFGKLAWFYHPHVIGTLVGVLFFLLLGAMPQSADHRDVFVVIIIVAPVWGALGFALNVYFHWIHARLLRLLYFKDWPGAVVAATRRLLIGHLDVKSPCTVRADARAGDVTVDHFPVAKGSPRLVELVKRIPGVEKVSVRESGERLKAESSILTIYTGLGDSATPVRVLQSTGWLPLAGGVLGAAVYLVGTIVLFLRGLFAGGLAYALSHGDLWSGQALLLKQGVVIGVVGWAVGFAAHRAVRFQVQRRLPDKLKAALGQAGLEMAEFRPGDSDVDIHVTANLTRSQAIELLGPVAAAHGVKRILLTTKPDTPDLRAGDANTAD